MFNNDKQTDTQLSLWKYFTDDAAKIKERNFQNRRISELNHSIKLK